MGAHTMICNTIAAAAATAIAAGCGAAANAATTAPLPPVTLCALPVAHPTAPATHAAHLMGPTPIGKTALNRACKHI